MDASKIKEFTDEHLETLAEMFGIAHWEIHIHIKQCPTDGCSGEIEVNPDYEWVNIWLDPNNIEDSSQLEEVLIHELLHIMDTPFRIFYRSVMEHLPENSNEEKAMKALFHYCMENHVKYLERMHRGHRKFYEKSGRFVDSERIKNCRLFSGSGIPPEKGPTIKEKPNG